ncbi:MAG: hypothetical protein NTX50_14930 [Candidatus Sumerlaeota bacterium]|nr:hypothetical protein [Candidatus Sumerlaeota bacterium]
MTLQMTIQTKPLRDVTTEALDILTKTLGPVDTLRFINQFTLGHGDYTEERKALFDNLSLDQIIAEIKQAREKA